VHALTRRRVLARDQAAAGRRVPAAGEAAAGGGDAAAPVVCVPSGNFGNLTAGVYAWHWGLPVSAFIAATNANDVVPEYLASGDFRPRPSQATLSNAMDVGNPSNFERLRGIFGSDWQAMRSRIRGDSVSDEETRKAMRDVFESFGVYLDPHTAVGYEAARRYLAAGGNTARRQPSGQVVVLSTAHPG
jgi:threonine synthase